MKSESGPNGANSLKRIFNCILYYFCNRQYFGEQKAKDGDQGTIMYSAVLKKNLKACKPSEHPSDRGEQLVVDVNFGCK